MAQNLPASDRDTCRAVGPPGCQRLLGHSSLWRSVRTSSAMLFSRLIRVNMLVKPPSVTEMACFIAELREQEVHVLGCGGGTVTGLAHSITWLRWVHGKRQLLRLTVHLILSSVSDDAAVQDVLDRVNDILYRYGDRRLFRELLELRRVWAKCTTVPNEPVSRDHASRSSRLEDLITQVRNRTC